MIYFRNIIMGISREWCICKGKEDLKLKWSISGFLEYFFEFKRGKNFFRDELFLF